MSDRKPPVAATKLAKKIGGTDYRENINQIADAIKAVADAARTLNASRLRRRAIVILIRDSVNVSIMDIENVLDAAENLSNKYLK